MRTSERLRILVPVRIIIKGLRGRLSGAILDLSKRGALLAINNSEGVQAGQLLIVSLVLPNGKPVKSIKGVICNVNPSTEKMFLGINFDERDKSSIRSVEEFYSECLSFLEDRPEPLQSGEAEMFNVGQKMTVEGGKKKMITRLRGWKLGEQGYILVDPPPPGQMSETLSPDLDIVVRSVKCGKFFGLEARFITVLDKINLRMFKTREDVLKFPLRSDDRAYCLIPASILRKIKGKYVEAAKGMIFDLSLGGAKFFTREPLPETEYHWVSFSLGIVGMVEFQKMKVVRKNIMNMTYEYAGPFVNMKKDNEKKLLRFFEFCQNW